MKKFLASMMIAVTAFSMIAEASARPLGGGRSIGRQSQSVTRQQQAAPAPFQRQQAAPAPAPMSPAAMQPKPPSRWKGMLGGALLGLGLGAMLSHFGLGGAMASAISSILMIALLAMAAMFIYRMFKRKDAPAASPFQQYANPVPAGHTPDIGSGLNQPAAFQPQSNMTYAPAAPAAPWGVPADFDTAAFLRHAKSSFIRMQAAWDKADVNDLREFTTPEVFAELKMQIQERGASPDFTDVVTIDGELLGIETVGSEYLASVKFTGMIKSAPNAPAEPFAEVWNMSKPVSGSSGWVLAGIQQLS
ncbi:TIM44-like domain-containing protein [Massilia sp. R2A-15]|uniref:Tim44 domain-containing protein n=1 Tax=Massilia sp. R2A-15 TaxID=3064278 RepID=UPI00273256AA|nr:TIM44-like domain-containing protein [Massilia sp. R2A-15]WLI89534.1 TIM44-like domain-containing protein [Massilia sp. R2A-15]